MHENGLKWLELGQFEADFSEVRWRKALLEVVYYAVGFKTVCLGDPARSVFFTTNPMRLFRRTSSSCVLFCERVFLPVSCVCSSLAVCDGQGELLRFNSAGNVCCCVCVSMIV